MGLAIHKDEMTNDEARMTKGMTKSQARIRRSELFFMGLFCGLIGYARAFTLFLANDGGEDEVEFFGFLPEDSGFLS
jgi:hypothetical protein